eukprot:GHVU01150367.1.p1 GENE.GHVU01150367.1~~GHVU01150367.1.p1  ORF type:complete len:928 (-),score=229.92 GHVU01150367.1:425-3208(-)
MSGPDENSAAAAAAAGGKMLDGIVKSVLSGDTLIVCGVPKGGPPPEKKVFLTGVMAPKVAFKSASFAQPDEPLGWESCRRLRTLCVGEKVDFKVDYVAGERACATVKLSAPVDGETDVSVVMLKEGLLRTTGSCNDAQQKAENSAKSGSKGMWTLDEDAKLATVREVSWGTGEPDIVTPFAELHKKEWLPAWVEYVRDAGCIRVIFEACEQNPTPLYCNVMLAGIRVDCWRRKDDGSGATVEEPFAAEGRFFVESRALHREVKVRVIGCDSYGNILGCVKHPKGDVGVALLRNGFATINEAAARGLDNSAELREAQREAQKNKLRKWKNYVAPSVESRTPKNVRVIEAVSGTCVWLREDGTNTEKRVYLASIIAPKMGGRNAAPDPYAWEAKEFVRTALVGNPKVSMTREYERLPQEGSAATPGPAPSDPSTGALHFVTLRYGVPPAATDLCEELVKAGLAKALFHRQEEPRAHNYDKLCDLSQAAEEKRLGMHGSVEKAPTHRVTDLVGPDNSSRAGTWLPQLQGKTLSGIIDVVFNVARFKITIPSMSVAISVVLGGLAAPHMARNEKQGSSEPFAEEGVLWSRREFLQRNVTLSVDSVNRGGSFVGTVWFEKKNIGAVVLRHGFATTTDFQMPGAHRTALLEAEEKAKEEKLKIWSRADGAAAAKAAAALPPKVILDPLCTAEVTHVESVTKLFAVKCPDERLAKLPDQLYTAQRQSDADQYARARPRRNEIVAAKFDGEVWYRARVTAGDATTAKLLYIDYGNSASVPVADCRPLPPDLCPPRLPALATECCLAGVHVMKDFENEAADWLSREAMGETLVLAHGHTHNSDTGALYVAVTRTGGAEKEKSLNARLLRAGLARLNESSVPKSLLESNKQLLEDMREAESEAKDERLAMWEYGDIGGDSEDEKKTSYPPLGGSKRR